MTEHVLNTGESEKLNNTRNLMMFLIPSLLGLLFFLAPLSVDGSVTFPLALMAKGLKGLLGDAILPLVTGVISFTALASLVASLAKPGLVTNSPLLTRLFCVSPAWLAVRLLGAVFTLMTLNQWGPEILWSADTGGLVLNDLLPSLFVTFFFAGLLLPLLLSFGLLELLGTLLSKVMRPLFRLPGRSAIDCLSSWLGDGTVGVILTSKQYEEKKYTQREAAVVATMFSTVGISFSLVVLTQVGLENYFVPFYGTICLAGVVAAMVIQYLPPLSYKKDVYIDGSTPNRDDELVPAGMSTAKYGYQLALQRASKVQSLGSVAKQGVGNALDMVIGVLPVVMAIGTVGLVIAEATPLFAWLGAPFVPLLEWLAVPQAAEAAQAVMVGFTDMYVPSILVTGLESDMTRFIIAALSVTQLIFMSETGSVILSSKLPLNFLELAALFLLRTLVTLPIIVLVAHWIF
ncbi:YjiH family protein [Ferrimonas marina]|uniref:Nucleoside recognition GATE domain-containing membrane protein YjiH n=1 Tax=Ferrimonas marina TaxID=299255 RepID=A0A1M5ZPZ4_9GAMM|nr:YjiH family protein [Ferrimonas marina]SHI26282.1 nucleoside recognition GATE domain-containing membrane protein YjiH [Ferrimonas marina]